MLCGDGAGAGNSGRARDQAQADCAIAEQAMPAEIVVYLPDRIAVLLSVWRRERVPNGCLHDVTPARDNRMPRWPGRGCAGVNSGQAPHTENVGRPRICSVIPYLDVF